VFTTSCYTNPRLPYHTLPVSLFSADSEAVFSRQQAMDEARRRMQEQFDAQAARHAEEVKKVRYIM